MKKFLVIVLLVCLLSGCSRVVDTYTAKYEVELLGCKYEDDWWTAGRIIRHIPESWWVYVKLGDETFRVNSEELYWEFGGHDGESVVGVFMCYKYSNGNIRGTLIDVEWPE